MIVTHRSLWRNLISMLHGRRPLLPAFTGLLGGQRDGRRTGPWMPPVDLYETADAFILKAALPGCSPQDIQMEVKQHALLLRGVRWPEREVNEDDYHCREWSSGAFQRSFLLPAAIEQEHITASYQDGVLKLLLPKTRAPHRGPSATHHTARLRPTHSTAQ
jgi:HSP20 family protein